MTFVHANLSTPDLVRPLPGFIRLDRGTLRREVFFAEFVTQSQAQVAMEVLQGYVFDLDDPSSASLRIDIVLDRFGD